MRKRIGVCWVDAGMLMVGDPCYFIGKDANIHAMCKDWDQACEEVFLNEDKAGDGMDVYGLGVAVHTTNGNGPYPVYLEKTKAGRRRLIVELD